MIVKNEAHIIIETLQNVLKYIDYWVISDTGSTDGTQKLITDFFKKNDIPGELVHHKWRDFGHNRTMALNCCYNKSDYILILDADDLIMGDLKIPENMTADAYSLLYGNTTVYRRTQLVKNRKLRWRYRGILHEFIECINKPNYDLQFLDGNYYVDSRRLGARNNIKNKYLRDAELLVKEINRDPNNELVSRYYFYTGQSYFDHGDYENSIKYYSKRIEYNGWYEEVYYSYFQIANSMRNMNNYSDEKIENAYMAAHNYLPSRAEPLYEIGVYYAQKNEYKKALKYILLSNSIPYPENQILFVNNDIYKWRNKIVLAELYAINGEFRKSKDILKILDCKDMPHDYKNKCEKMLHSITQNLKDNYVEYNQKKIEILTSIIKSQKNKKNGIIFTITTCKRLELFKKTINSFLNCCEDLSLIDRWICIDDNSCDADRKEMQELYPFFEFIFKTPEQKGHVKSMNMIREIALSDQSIKYVLHIEDDWQFFEKEKYIRKAQDIFNNNTITNSSTKIGQVLFNKNYIETTDEYIYGGFKHTTSTGQSFIVHEYYEDPDECKKMCNQYKKTCIWWPHYSLRPSLLSTEIFNIGEYEENGKFFEKIYAEKYTKAGYISVFFDDFTSWHIGKLTWQSGENAYSLNEVSQFTGSDMSKYEIITDDNYVFFPNKDSYEGDLCYRGFMPIKMLLEIANNQESCVAFNTYGYFKHKISHQDNFVELKNIYNNPDGLYVKRKYINSVLNQNI